MTVDSSGNVYASGYSQGTFDGNSSSGGDDIVLVKYNSSGTQQWIRQLGTDQSDIAEDIAIDSSDNIFLTGRTNGNLDGNTGLGNWDFILVKYNSSGVLQ